MFDLKRSVLDESPWYWVPIFNKVPDLKVLVLDDLPGHLKIIPDRLPVIDLKRFVLDESPRYWVPVESLTKCLCTTSLSWTTFLKFGDCF